MISSLVELEMHGRPGLPEKQAPGYSLRAAVSPLLIVLSLVLRLGPGAGSGPISMSGVFNDLKIFVSFNLVDRLRTVTS